MLGGCYGALVDKACIARTLHIHNPTYPHNCSVATGMPMLTSYSVKPVESTSCPSCHVTHIQHLDIQNSLCLIEISCWQMQHLLTSQCNEVLVRRGPARTQTVFPRPILGYGYPARHRNSKLQTTRSSTSDINSHTIPSLSTFYSPQEAAATKKVSHIGCPDIYRQYISPLVQTPSGQVWGAIGALIGMKPVQNELPHKQGCGLKETWFSLGSQCPGPGASVDSATLSIATSSP